MNAKKINTALLAGILLIALIAILPAVSAQVKQIQCEDITWDAVITFEESPDKYDLSYYKKEYGVDFQNAAIALAENTAWTSAGENFEKDSVTKSEPNSVSVSGKAEESLNFNLNKPVTAIGMYIGNGEDDNPLASLTVSNKDWKIAGSIEVQNIQEDVTTCIALVSDEPLYSVSLGYMLADKTGYVPNAETIDNLMLKYAETTSPAPKDKEIEIEGEMIVRVTAADPCSGKISWVANGIVTVYKDAFISEENTVEAGTSIESKEITFEGEHLSFILPLLPSDELYAVNANIKGYKERAVYYKPGTGIPLTITVESSSGKAECITSQDLDKIKTISKEKEELLRNIAVPETETIREVIETEEEVKETCSVNACDMVHKLWRYIKFLEKKIEEHDERILRLEALLLPTVEEVKEKEEGQGTLIVKVFDASGNPTENARITIARTDSVDIEAKATESGKAEFKLRAGRYTVRAEAVIEGQYLQTSAFTKVLPNDVTELDLVLRQVGLPAFADETRVTAREEGGFNAEDAIVTTTVTGEDIRLRNNRLYLERRVAGEQVVETALNPREIVVRTMMERRNLTREQANDFVKRRVRNAEINMDERTVRVTRDNEIPIINIFVPTVTEELDLPETVGIIITGNKPAKKVGIIITGDKPTGKVEIIIQNGKTLLTTHLMKTHNWSQLEAENVIQTDIKTAKLTLSKNKIMIEIQYMNGDIVTEEVASEAMKEVTGVTGISGETGIIIQNGKVVKAAIIIQNGLLPEEAGIIIQNG